MKKIILTAFAVFLCGFVKAQEIKYGIKGGLNVANLSENFYASNSPKTGFHIGGFAQIRLSEKFVFQPEVLFSTQGTKVDNASIYDGQNRYFGSVIQNLNYINVPLMFKYYAIEKFSIEAGPQIGFLTSETTKIEVHGVNETKIDANNSYKNFDFGLNLGVGYDITKNITVGTRYNLGLSNIGKTVVEGYGPPKAHNRVFSLSVGYKF
ncbi:Opacity protein [Flavobacterium resistens]|uniref:Opacity protein n=1 Tax=Flavobacterium resistens TaxID=443612 RepID=A0A521EZD9_9FLAO|nr:porin family protein [Flavobacterium resistens]MRX69327.1 outer membrane beta-barrel protein [Flavobacterium resistens]SMO89237.1 Opacity protein [Flavobacterium resistens]